MEGKELKKLKKAVKLRDIGKMISLVKDIPASQAVEAERMLSEFYNHEVCVANAVMEMDAYAKIYKSKVKPPLKGCFGFVVSKSNK